MAGWFVRSVIAPSALEDIATPSVSARDPFLNRTERLLRDPF
jgi:hypothetical protein